METMDLGDFLKQYSGADAEKNLARRNAGRKANAVGDAWQERLDLYHTMLLKDRKVTKLQRQMPAMRSTFMSVRGRKTLVFVPIDKGPCDYLFVLLGGRVGIFDAKTTDAAKQFTWPESTAHQLDEMRRQLELAPESIAFALTNWRAHDEVRIHPIWTIEDRTVYRAEGIKIEGVQWLNALPYIFSPN